MRYLPPHNVTDQKKLSEMISILEGGGELPPVLTNGEQAYSGSHRIAAWDALEMDHNAVELDDDEYVAVMENINLDPVYDTVCDFEPFLASAVELGFAGAAR